ncbi:MAG TPA: ABC transporter substrate-binding protein [Bordetella sp.]|nr:ABC transporter substrate-binding protein [Bordetella sp.]
MNTHKYQPRTSWRIPLAMLAGLLAGAQASAAQSVRIGIVADMSGVYADVSGAGVVHGATLAAQDFMQRNPGWKVEILAADHQNKADIASARAREWIDRDNVDMVMNGANSATGLAVAGVAAAKHRVNFDVGAATTRLSNESCTPYTVQYVYDTYMLSHATASALVKHGGKRWFFLTADYAFGHSLEADTSKTVTQSGGEVLGAVRHPVNTPDFSSYLLQAQSSRADVIGLANAGGDTINAIKTANEFGLTAQQKLAGLLLFINDIDSLTLPVAKNMYLTTAWYWDLNDDTRAFGKRYFQKMKRMPNMAQAGAYSAVSTYLEATLKTGGKDADAVMKTLKSMTIQDMFTRGGRIRADGRMVHEAYLMRVKQPDQSRYPWDYYDIVETIAAEDTVLPLAQSRCPLVEKPQ